MRIYHILFASMLVTVGPAAGAAPAASAQAPLHIIARYPIGGNETGYDYVRVDAGTRRVFVAHATRVEVLDADTGRKLGEIGGMHGVHGIEIIDALGKGYTSDGLDRAVTVFDQGTLKILKRIKYTGVKPDAIQYDPESRRLFVVNGGAGGDLTVIDPVTDSIVGVVELGGGKLEQIGFDGQGRGFVNDEQRAVVHVFDTHSLKPLGLWPLAPCAEPTGLAVDVAHHRAFAACGNEKLAVLDLDTGRLVAMPEIGEDPDGAVFDPATQRIFTSNRIGTLSVLREMTPDRYEPLQTLTTLPGARTLAFDAGTGRLFLPTARLGAATPGGAAAILPASFEILVVGP